MNNTASFWDDGTPRSMHSGFLLGLTDDHAGAWKSWRSSAVHSANSAATLERKRAAGIPDPGMMNGSGTAKRAATKPHSGSKAAQLRNELRSGPKGREELAAAVGIEARNVRQYLAHDIDNGRIVAVDGSPVRYALVPGAGA